MKITVLEIAIVLSTCCLLLGSMMGGSPYSSLPYIELLANVFVAFEVCALAICAFVMTGYRRAFAIGFCIPACLYGASVAYPGNEDFEIGSRAKHPASSYLRALYHQVGRDTAVDANTGEEIDDFKSLRLRERQELQPIIYLKVPQPASFLYYAHLLLFVALGYLGGNFGRWALWFDSIKGRTMA